MISNNKQKLRNAVRFAYDLQQLRIATFHRNVKKTGAAPPVDLDEDDRKTHGVFEQEMTRIEKAAFKEVERLSSKFPIYEWLRGVRGIGPISAGFLISEFDIERAVNPSMFWAYAGLHVVDGHSPHPTKGEKLPYNGWLRSKCIAVVGGGLLKAKNPEYRKRYDDRRHSRMTLLATCFLCNGTGKAAQPKTDEDGKVSAEAGKLKKCWNCVGYKRNEVVRNADGTPALVEEIDKETGESEMAEQVKKVARPFAPDAAPWGKGDAHRHADAQRIMVKQFLADFWRAWRVAEGLPVVEPYNEARRGYQHHS